MTILNPTDNPPAYPVHPGVRADAYEGMTLRDAFAIAALPKSLDIAYEKAQSISPEGLMSEVFLVASHYSYQLADAMLEARKQHG